MRLKRWQSDLLQNLLVDDRTDEALSLAHGVYYWSVTPDPEYPDNPNQRAWQITFNSPKGVPIHLLIFLNSNVVSGDLIIPNDAEMIIEAKEAAGWIQVFHGLETKELKLPNLRNVVENALKDLIGAGNRAEQEKQQPGAKGGFWQNLDKKV
jgi:hypothetical protein